MGLLPNPRYPSDHARAPLIPAVHPTPAITSHLTFATERSSSQDCEGETARTDYVPSPMYSGCGGSRFLDPLARIRITSRQPPSRVQGSDACGHIAAGRRSRLSSVRVSSASDPWTTVIASDQQRPFISSAHRGSLHTCIALRPSTIPYYQISIPIHARRSTLVCRKCANDIPRSRRHYPIPRVGGADSNLPQINVRKPPRRYVWEYRRRRV